MGGSGAEGGRQGSGDGEQGGGSQTVYPAPGDVGDGSNDDILARQLRELAEAEKDPILREKLWEEYRQYKKSIGK